MENGIFAIEKQNKTDMIISTLEELRLYNPSIAIDNIEALSGCFDASEHDFLEDKLGSDLYPKLIEYYRGIQADVASSFVNEVINGNDLPPYAQLLTVCQRIVVFDALANAIDMQILSVNGAGVNLSTAKDYETPSQSMLSGYKSQCVKNAHVALNRLLVLLEDWTKQIAQLDPDEEITDTSVSEKEEITVAWASGSRYYFLAAGLIIPSALVLQDYLNIYSSREKFITMLPDLRYIQEDIISPTIGEDLVNYLCSVALKGTTDKVLARSIHQMRKAVARELESRTMAIKIDDPRRNTAHSEAVKLMGDLASYIKVNQESFPEDAADALKASPLYVDPDTEEETYTPKFQNNMNGAAMFVTPAMN